MATELTPFLSGLAFGESPRWHGGALWLSDFYDGHVLRVSEDAHVDVVVSVPGQPSGLGWLPDGRLLVVSMLERRLYAWDGHRLAPYADLAGVAPAPCNDMLVDAKGNAWVGNFGFDLVGRAPFVPAPLVHVAMDGSVRVAATDLHFPNGTVQTPDGRTLIVAESYAKRLTAFDIAADGALSRRRVWADLGDATPDGICLDAEGAVWLASPITREVLRVREGGQVTDRVPTAAAAVACMLGGADRRTLYVVTGKVMTTPEQSRERRSGQVWALHVSVPGAGLP